MVFTKEEIKQRALSLGAISCYPGSAQRRVNHLSPRRGASLNHLSAGNMYPVHGYELRSLLSLQPRTKPRSLRSSRKAMGPKGMVLR